MRVIAAALLGALVAGCTGGATQDTLAKACQFQNCVCVDASALLPQVAERKPVEWEPTGNASCPEGFELRLGPKENSRRW